MADAAGTRRRSRPAASRFAHQQDERLDPVLQLVVGADRQVGLAGADTDQRDTQLVAQNRMRLRNSGPVSPHQHSDPDRPPQSQRQLLQLGQPLAGPQRRAQRGQQHRVEAGHRSSDGICTASTRISSRSALTSSRSSHACVPVTMSPGAVPPTAPRVPPTSPSARRRSGYAHRSPSDIRASDRQPMPLVDDHQIDHHVIDLDLVQVKRGGLFRSPHATCRRSPRRVQCRTGDVLGCAAGCCLGGVAPWENELDSGPRCGLG
jgi:hypothetical protein